MPSERSGLNNLQVAIYDGLSTSPLTDSAGDLPRAQGIVFSTQYPGGIHGDAEMFIPRDPTQSWPFAGNDRLVIRNGIAIAWEGTVSGIGYMAGDGAEQGRRIIGQGWWGTLAGKRGINKPWADDRVSEDVWQQIASPYNTNDQPAARDSLDRRNGLRFTPIVVANALNDFERVMYTAPTGQTVKRWSFTDDMQESVQVWSFRAFGMTGASTLYDRNTSGSSANNLTLGTPSQKIFYLFLSGAAQTPSACGIYGAACAIMVYTTTVASVNACNIGLDIITQANTAAASPINSYTGGIANPAFTLEPFISNGYEPLGDVLLRAVGYGDASFNQWAAYFDHSETAATPNGKPVLNIAQYAALTDYDYAVRFDDPNVIPPLEVTRNWDDVWNWIVVSYRDELNNRTVYLTPDDNANLKDTTSITDWGQREYVLDVGQSGSAMALNAGRRLLAAKKDAKFYVAGPIAVQSYIRGKNGNPVPSSLIRAGQRIKIENFLEDQVGVGGAGLTFTISRTRYTDRDETCSIDCGTPDDLAVFLAQLARKMT